MCLPPTRATWTSWPRRPLILIEWSWTWKDSTFVAKKHKKNLLRRANSSRGEQSPFFAMVNRVLLSYLISNVNIKYQGKALNAAYFFLSYPATTLHLVKRFNVRLHSHHSQGFLWGSRNEDRSRVPSHSHGATLSPTLRF